MIQAWALFVDAYRELNDRKLFWISLLLSALGAGAFATVGVDERGLTLLWWSFDSRFFNSTVVPPETFYKLLFVTLGVKFWLAWLATILALVSTAGIIPDLVASGSVDLMLSKPIGRARLFLLKFLTGLLFSGLQVTVFSLASFVVIGLRGNAWEPGLFLAVPIVVLVYSYVFSMCALLGMVTRSTVASLLLTLLLWALTVGLWGASQAVATGRTASRLEIQAIQRVIDVRRTRDGDEADTQALERELTEQKEADGRWEVADAIVGGVASVLPKTTATVELLERWIADAADLRLQRMDEESQRPLFGTKRVKEKDLLKAMKEHRDALTPAWIIGTSLAFEAVVLGVAVLIFTRRDF